MGEIGCPQLVRYYLLSDSLRGDTGGRVGQALLSVSHSSLTFPVHIVLFPSKPRSLNGA